MEMANFSILSPPTYKGASLRSLKPSNYPFNCSFYSVHHHIRFSKSSTKFKRKSFKISCSISSSSLKDNCRNSDANCNDSITDVWSDSQFVEVIGIGNRVDSVLDFCISSHSTSHSLRFWNVIRRDSSTGQLRQRILEKDDYPNTAEAPLNQQLHSKAVVLVCTFLPLSCVFIQFF